MRYSYIPEGICPEEIRFDIEGGKLKNVEFEGGCEGNLQALSRLVEGMDTTEAVAVFKGIDCEGRGTSCPDQFAAAIEEMMK